MRFTVPNKTHYCCLTWLEQPREQLTLEKKNQLVDRDSRQPRRKHQNFEVNLKLLKLI
jgi:hypothetical protein